MGADMQALDDFRELQQHLRSAQIARSVMTGEFSQSRRDQATIAYGRSLDRIFDVLDRLDREALNGHPGCRATLPVLEEFLVSIANAERTLARL